MHRLLRHSAAALICLGLVWLPGALGQPLPDVEDTILNPVPPPLPPPAEAEDDDAGADDATSEYKAILPESDVAWGLDLAMRERLIGKAELYSRYTKRFLVDETARLASYNGAGYASEEEIRNYAYLLLSDPAGGSFKEFRQAFTKKGKVKSGAIQDEEPFPPAYAWVFLFSEFNQPFISYRYLGDHFDGFDWVYEIQFKGSLPFRDGQDIRQWSGTVLIDATTYCPLEILAEPSGQSDRIRAMYQMYMESFNIVGFRTKPKPLGHRASVQFRHRRDALSFPTELRYDTFRAVGPTQILPIEASIRSYSQYRITRVLTDEDLSETEADSGQTE